MGLRLFGWFLDCFGPFPRQMELLGGALAHLDGLKVVGSVGIVGRHDEIPAAVADPEMLGDLRVCVGLAVLWF